MAFFVAQKRLRRRPVAFFVFFQPNSQWKNFLDFFLAKSRHSSRGVLRRKTNLVEFNLTLPSTDKLGSEGDRRLLSHF